MLKEKSRADTAIKELHIHDIIAAAINGGKSFAFWKKQGQTDLQGIIDLGDHPSYDKSDLENATPGFLVSPFLNDGRSKNIKIKADLVFYPGGDTSYFQVTPSAKTSGQAIDFFLEKLTAPRINSERLAAYLPPAGQQNSQGDFKKTVADAVDEIKKGHLFKVVPSRYTEVSYPDGWGFIRAFEKLHALYPNAFVYIFGIPGVGTWMGATPELLLSIIDQRWFKSVALAGTQRLPESGDVSQVAWMQKEIEEQALVARYVINCFKKIRLREFDEKGPKTVKAGNLAHLKTEFYVDMEAVNFPQLGTVMLDLLHPTSAVCGMPLEDARQFLANHEGYDREFFSGYLGPVNIDNATQLFVNLRSMKLLADRARLYAGAGVTEDSVVEREWEETELKFQTLKRLFE